MPSIRLQADFHGEYTVMFQPKLPRTCALAEWESSRRERDTREWFGGRESKKIPAEFSNIIFIDYLMQKLFHRRVLLQFAKIEAEIFANYIKQKFLNPTSSPSSNFSHPLTATRPSCVSFFLGWGRKGCVWLSAPLLAAYFALIQLRHISAVLLCALRVLYNRLGLCPLESH